MNLVSINKNKFSQKKKCVGEYIPQNPGGQMATKGNLTKSLVHRSMKLLKKQIKNKETDRSLCPQLLFGLTADIHSQSTIKLFKQKSLSISSFLHSPIT